MNLSKEQLDKIYQEGNHKVKEILTKSGYQRPFEVGDFVALMGHKIFGLITKINGLMIYFNGIDYKGNYTEEDWFTFGGGASYHPTKEEIESHLIKVAEPKGYKEGVKVKYLESDSVVVLNGDFNYNGEYLIAYIDGGEYIYIWRKSDNKWAEIIEEPKYRIEEDIETNIYLGEEYIGRIKTKENALKICGLLNFKAKKSANT